MDEFADLIGIEKPPRTSRQKVTRFILPQLGQLPAKAPPLLLTSSLQKLRSTRPPVPRSQLTRFPYTKSPIIAPCNHRKGKCLCFPLPIPHSEVTIRRRRRQRKRSVRQRTTPSHFGNTRWNRIQEPTSLEEFNYCSGAPLGGHINT